MEYSPIGYHLVQIHNYWHTSAALMSHTYSLNILNHPTMLSPIHPIFKLNAEMSANHTTHATMAAAPIPSSICIDNADANTNLCWIHSLLNDPLWVGEEQHTTTIIIQWVVLLVTTLLTYISMSLYDIQQWLFELKANNDKVIAVASTPCSS